jgi:molybdopterin converting factor small subunit
MDVVKNQLMQMKTVFRAKAGPVEYETQQSAQVLKGLLDAYMKERDLILANLASTNMVSSYYIDTLRARDYAIADGIIDWVAY